MSRYYVTFGYNSANRDHYQVVIAPDEHAARALVHKAHGQRWAFLYDETEKPEAIDYYNLTPLATILGEDE